jgi:hypothetical protein
MGSKCPKIDVSLGRNYGVSRVSHDPKDPLDKIADTIRNRKPPRKVSKATKTLLLEEPQYSIFQQYCRTKDIGVSAVIDSLIGAFLERIMDDLPPEIRDRLKKR